MKSIKFTIFGLAFIGAISFTGCEGDYLDTTASNAISETTVNSSLDISI